ncbi:MAG TPA: type 4a pilus biogenesis protein PilO [Fimbriimonas sp.]|nr:type 4a pilus biogenesis protein PilO [Fimbriimonas sp.]
MKKASNANLFFALAAIAVLGGGGFLFLQNSSLDTQRDEVRSLEKQASQASTVSAQLVDAKKSLNELQTKLAHLEQGLPDSAYVPTMLKELELMGKSQNLEVTGLRPSIKRPTSNAKDREMAKKPYEPLDLELKAKARYSDLVNFVRALDSFPKIVAVRTLAIVPPAPGARAHDDRLDVTMGLRAFLFKQSQPQTAVKADGGSA